MSLIEMINSKLDRYNGDADCRLLATSFHTMLLFNADF